MYEQRTTQENQILDLLGERKGMGAYSYELAKPKPDGCGVLQYNARIYGLRKKGHNIVSDFKGHFILQERTQEPMTKAELDQKLAELRKDWTKAGSGMRKLIEVRAKLLKKQFNEKNKTERKEEYDASVAWKEIQDKQEV